MADPGTRQPVRRRPDGLRQPSPSAIASAADRVGRAAPPPAAGAAPAVAAAAIPAMVDGRPVDREALLARAGQALADLLERQSGAHERMLEHLHRTREAIRSADVAAVAECCGRERELLAEIQELEARRREVVDGVTRIVAPGRREPLPLTELTGHLPDEAAARLLQLGETLRRSLEESARVSSIVTAAAEAVGRQLSGLVQTIGTVIAGPGTYGRRGRVESAASSSSIRLDFVS
jgi:hypothetical protein